MEIRIKNTLEAFEKNKITALYFATVDEAYQFLLEQISLTDTVGIGGSVTLKELGMPEALRDRGNEIFYHWMETTPEGINYARVKAQRSDVYLTGSNAITENGEIINVDGVGNRVSTMIFGPKKVYVIVGINKLVANEKEGIERIRNNAWKNAVRLGLKVPCVNEHKCVDCNHVQRMCNITTIIKKKPSLTNLNIVIIGENMGF